MSREKIFGDYIVVATGPDYASPFKPQDGTYKSLRQNLKEVHAKLRIAQTIAIVGAGTVGIELAGEIAHAYPDVDTHLSASPDVSFKLRRPIGETT